MSAGNDCVDNTLGDEIAQKANEKLAETVEIIESEAGNLDIVVKYLMDEKNRLEEIYRKQNTRLEGLE